MKNAGREKTSQDYIDEFIKMEDDDEDLGVSEVNRFYDGCNVLVTGGSGFIGKLLIEKLLRVTNLNTIYVMMRPKKGKTIKERFDEQFQDVVYDRLRKVKPNFADKLVIVNGETGAPDLGISAEDLDTLKEKVNLIFHCAANVRFDEKLRKVVETNVRGTKLLLELAKEMKHFKAFVHISTAFSHCTLKFIEEKFYAPPIEADKILELMDLLNDDALECVTPSIVGEFPNTYAFSKAIAEDVVQKYGKDIPSCVVRPSIVIATYDEPIAGWINNLYGPTGVTVGAAAGVMRTLHCCKNKIADIIPADYVVNNIVAAAWDTAVTWQDKQKHAGWETLSLTPEEEKDPVIYNCVSSCQNPVTWDSYMYLNFSHGLDVPSTKSIWYVYFILNRELWRHNVCVFFLHLFPGFLLDLVAMLFRRKPIFMETYRKIHKFSSVISYFCTQQWLFTNNEVLRLWDKLTPIDKQQYDFLVSNYDWETYFRRHVFGLRVFLMKDPMEMASIEAGRKHYHMLKIVHYTFTAVLFSSFMLLSGCIIYKLVWMVFSLFIFLWNRY